MRRIHVNAGRCGEGNGGPERPRAQASLRTRSRVARAEQGDPPGPYACFRQRHLTVVVDHHTGRLVWAASGRDRRTVLAFFDALGEQRCEQVELVSADMARWIAGPIAERCPHEVRCVDPFHVISLATDALDEARREVWNQARRGERRACQGSQRRAVRGLEEPGEPY